MAMANLAWHPSVCVCTEEEEEEELQTLRNCSAVANKWNCVEKVRKSVIEMA